MKKFRWFLKLIIINSATLFIILLSLEIGGRLSYVAKRCLFTKNCSEVKDLLTNIKINPLTETTYLGLARYDDRLGWVPREGFDEFINDSNWNNKRVSIDKSSFRINKFNDEISKKNILVVGDSMTFGDQVSNEETWPSCLQEISNMGVKNGGVFGYGTGQALLRAKYEIENSNNYKFLILSSYIKDDFNRDRLNYSSGFPKPSLIKINGEIKWSKTSDKYKLGTKYNPNPNKILKNIWEKSFLASYIMHKNNFQQNISGDMLNSLHPNAVSVEEAIDWSLINLSKINVPKKYFLIQYAAEDMDNLKINELRKLIKEKSKNLNFKIIDSYEKVKSLPSKLVWNGHHTPKGNNLLCEEVFTFIKKDL